MTEYPGFDNSAWVIESGVGHRTDVVSFVVQQGKASPNAVFAGSVPYLMLAGNLVAGWQMARALLVAEDLLPKGQDQAFLQAKITTARFYADHILA